MSSSHKANHNQQQRAINDDESSRNTRQDDYDVQHDNKRQRQDSINIARRRELEAEVRRELYIERQLPMSRVSQRPYFSGPLYRPGFSGLGCQEPRLSPYYGLRNSGFCGNLPVRSTVSCYGSGGLALEGSGQSDCLGLVARRSGLITEDLPGVSMGRKSEPINSKVAGSKRKAESQAVVGRAERKAESLAVAVASGKRKAESQEVAEAEENSVSDMARKQTQEVWSCSICQVSATSERGLEEHFKGKKHKAKVAKLSKQKEAEALRESVKAMKPADKGASSTKQKSEAQGAPGNHNEENKDKAKEASMMEGQASKEQIEGEELKAEDASTDVKKMVEELAFTKLIEEIRQEAKEATMRKLKMKEKQAVENPIKGKEAEAEKAASCVQKMKEEGAVEKVIEESKQKAKEASLIKEKMEEKQAAEDPVEGKEPMVQEASLGKQNMEEKQAAEDPIKGKVPKAKQTSSGKEKMDEKQAVEDPVKGKELVVREASLSIEKMEGKQPAEYPVKGKEPKAKKTSLGKQKMGGKQAVEDSVKGKELGVKEASSSKEKVEEKQAVEVALEGQDLEDKKASLGKQKMEGKLAGEEPMRGKELQAKKATSSKQKTEEPTSEKQSANREPKDHIFWCKLCDFGTDIKSSMDAHRGGEKHWKMLLNYGGGLIIIRTEANGDQEADAPAEE